MTPGRAEPAGAFCSECALGPARVLTVRSHLGLVVIARVTRVRAPFCRDHGILAAKRHRRRTLLAGWWWILGPLANWIPIASNAVALRRARRLPFPVDPAKRAKTPSAPAAVPEDTPEQRRARRAVLLTVAIGVGVGIATLIAVTLSGTELSIALDRRLAMVDAATVTLYALVGVLVTQRLRDPSLRPRWTDGPAGRALGIGAAVGAGTALLLVVLNSLIAGRPASDPSVVAVFYDAHPVHVAALVFVIAIVAPVFEEMLFRGLLVESFRSRGRTSAVLAGAAAFAIWHLNPAGLRYYVLVGFLLGYLYWRLGLAGSIATHAAFNGLLLVAAVVALSSGGHRVEVEGVRMDVPVGWSEVTEEAPSDVDIAVESPNGAVLAVQHSDGSGRPRLRDTPGARSLRPVSVSGIDGVRFTSEPEGVPTETIVLTRAGRAWVITFISGGSGRAARDFEAILPTIELYG